jgi:hypothetical protein
MSVMIPDSTDLDDAPERALLAVLDVALAMAELALLSEHPTARTPDPWEDESSAPLVVVAARDVLHAVRALRCRLRCYEHTVALFPPPSPCFSTKPMPF